MSERNFETIVEGGYYKGKDGEVVGPAVRTDDAYRQWKCGKYSYTEDGFFYHDKRDCKYDLIARVNQDGTPWVEPVEQTEPEKRLPQLGEAWLTRDGLVAHVRYALPGGIYPLGGYILSRHGKRTETWTAEGCSIIDCDTHPNDLVEYIGPIEQLPVVDKAEDDQSRGSDSIAIAIGGVYSTDDLDPHVCDHEFSCDVRELSVKLIDGRDAWFTKAKGGLWECVGIGECEEAAPSAKQVLENVDAELFNKALAGERGEDQQRIANEVAKLGAMLLRKNADYGSSAWKRPVLAPHINPGDSILVRMSDKIERILSLATKPPEVAEEKVEQTIDDFAGYWILAKAAPGRAK